jgi:hypothetical protein
MRLFQARRDRITESEALLDVTLDRERSRPTPEWVSIERTYPGEGNAIDTVAMTLAEFWWLVDEVAPRMREALAQPENPTRVELVPNGPGEDDYDPEVTLEYSPKRHELYVIVGEEVSGMAETVPETTWARIVKRLT